MAKKKIGALLEEKGLINEFQLVAALSHQRKWKTKLGQSLIELGYLEEEQLYQVLAEQLEMELVNLGQTDLDPAALKKIGKETARKLQAVPVRYKEGDWTVAVAEPDAPGLAESLAECLGGRITLVLATPTDIELTARKIPDKVQVASVQPVKKAFVRDENGNFTALEDEGLEDRLNEINEKMKKEAESAMPGPEESDWMGIPESEQALSPGAGPPQSAQPQEEAQAPQVEAPPLPDKAGQFPAQQETVDQEVEEIEAQPAARPKEEQAPLEQPRETAADIPAAGAEPPSETPPQQPVETPPAEQGPVPVEPAHETAAAQSQEPAPPEQPLETPSQQPFEMPPAEQGPVPVEPAHETAAAQSQEPAPPEQPLETPPDEPIAMPPDEELAMPPAEEEQPVETPPDEPIVMPPDEELAMPPAEEEQPFETPADEPVQASPDPFGQPPLGMTDPEELDLDSLMPPPLSEDESASLSEPPQEQPETAAPKEEPIPAEPAEPPPDLPGPPADQGGLGEEPPSFEAPPMEEAPAAGTPESAAPPEQEEPIPAEPAEPPPDLPGPDQQTSEKELSEESLDVPTLDSILGTPGEEPAGPPLDAAETDQVQAPPLEDMLAGEPEQPREPETPGAVTEPTPMQEPVSEAPSFEAPAAQPTLVEAPPLPDEHVQEIPGSPGEQEPDIDDLEVVDDEEQEAEPAEQEQPEANKTDEDTDAVMERIKSIEDQIKALTGVLGDLKGMLDKGKDKEKQ